MEQREREQEQEQEEWHLISYGSAIGEALDPFKDGSRLVTLMPVCCRCTFCDIEDEVKVYIRTSDLGFHYRPFCSISCYDKWEKSGRRARIRLNPE